MIQLKIQPFTGALPIRNLYGKFPELNEMMAVIRNIYGDDFMQIFERSFKNIEQEYQDVDGKIVKNETERESKPI